MGLQAYASHRAVLMENRVALVTPIPTLVAAIAATRQHREQPAPGEALHEGLVELIDLLAEP